MQLSTFPNLADPKLAITPPTTGGPVDPLAALSGDPAVGLDPTLVKPDAFAAIFGGLVMPGGPARPCPAGIVLASHGPSAPIPLRGLRADFPFSTPEVKVTSDGKVSSDEAKSDEVGSKPSLGSDKDRLADPQQTPTSVQVTPTIVPEMVQVALNLPPACPVHAAGEGEPTSSEEFDLTSTIAEPAPAAVGGLPTKVESEEPLRAVFGKKDNRDFQWPTEYAPTASRPASSEKRKGESMADVPEKTDTEASAPSATPGESEAPLRDDVAPFSRRAAFPDAARTSALPASAGNPARGSADRDANFRVPPDAAPASEPGKFTGEVDNGSNAQVVTVVRTDAPPSQSGLRENGVAALPATAIEGKPLAPSGRGMEEDKSKREIGVGNTTSWRSERTAKFAESSGKAFSMEPAPDQAAFKKTLDPDFKPVTKHDDTLGTSVAKPETVMPAALSSRRETSAPTAHVAGVAGPHVSAAELTTSAVPAAAGSAAQKAVETVLSLAERFASADKHSVNLQFSIGGSDLQVRVEMRADEVRTAFRTESPDLRAALVHEWQAVSMTTSDRSPIRFADPVFTSATSGGHDGAAFSSDTASQQQRESAARREAMNALPDFLRSSKPATTPAALSSAAPLRPATHAGAQQRLSTFA